MSLDFYHGLLTAPPVVVSVQLEAADDLAPLVAMASAHR
jgi:hypothetical protein